MILLKITNCSELVASKVGKFVEKLTPDGIDQTIVEEIVVKQMLETLSSEGLKGEITLIDGINIENKKLTLDDAFSIGEQSIF